jgi:hypothetical protein
LQISGGMGEMRLTASIRQITSSESVGRDRLFASADLPAVSFRLSRDPHDSSNGSVDRKRRAENPKMHIHQQRRVVLL